MKNLLKRLFGHSTTSAASGGAAGSARENRDSPLTIEDGSENATRRQLVQVLLRDVLRKSGIPPEWLECQMLLVASRTRGQGMYVRLIVKHWDERLMNYLFAFQQTLMTDICHFEPNAVSWLHGISWQLDLDDKCPYAALPDKSFWVEALQAPEPPMAEVFAAPIAIPEVLDEPDKPAFKATIDDEEVTRASDLERLFAIRDQELDRQAAHGISPVGYEKTQPSSL
ncbi:MAG: hypothetical protein V4625_00890 [Pseudomonadota bacterium]